MSSAAKREAVCGKSAEATGAPRCPYFAHSIALQSIICGLRQEPRDCVFDFGKLVPKCTKLSRLVRQKTPHRRQVVRHRGSSWSLVDVSAQGRSAL